MKSALITGVTGQDGAYLAAYLLKKGYDVFGTYRRVSSPTFWRLRYLGIEKKVRFISADLADSGSIANALLVSSPDEVYHLAAQSFVEASFDQPVATGEITGLSVTRILDAIRLIKPSARFYQASSSEMFGGDSGRLKNEETKFQPSSPYAAAKLYGYWITRTYRDAYRLFATNGILFNHESPLRGLEFVTRKVTNTAAMISLGLSKQLSLGNMAARRDWGFAPEYVESMWKMLQADAPADYVVATGKLHSVKELVETTFAHLGLDWKDYVKVDKRLFRPKDVAALGGDIRNARLTLEWRPKMTFEEIVRLMTDTDLKRWRDALDGQIFPWDFPSSMGVEGVLENKSHHRP